jgi:dTMP kinase
MARGVLVTIEGGEGAGKSTQLARLAAALRQAGREVVATREPGGTEEAEAIRALLVGGVPGRWDPVAETLLHYAARAQHVARLVRPALEHGAVVVCDRFADSTMAYQGFGQGVPRETIRAIHAAALGRFAPDLTLILDLPVETGLARAAGRRATNRYERFDAAFHARVRDGFLTIAREEPGRCVVIDAARPPDAVWAAIVAAVSGRLRLELEDAA